MANSGFRGCRGGSCACREIASRGGLTGVRTSIEGVPISFDGLVAGKSSRVGGTGTGMVSRPHRVSLACTTLGMAARCQSGGQDMAHVICVVACLLGRHPYTLRGCPCAPSRGSLCVGGVRSIVLGMTPTCPHRAAQHSAGDGRTAPRMATQRRGQTHRAPGDVRHTVWGAICLLTLASATDRGI
jgi:hypothetical protein